MRGVFHQSVSVRGLSRVCCRRYAAGLTCQGRHSLGEAFSVNVRADGCAGLPTWCRLAFFWKQLPDM